MFRAKMAQATPINVLTAKKKSDGLTQQEVADYKRVFNKVWTQQALEECRLQGVRQLAVNGNISG